MTTASILLFGFVEGFKMTKGARTVFLNDCPYNGQRTVSKNTIFFHGKYSRFYPQIIRKSVFLIGQVPKKKYGLKSGPIFAI